MYEVLLERNVEKELRRLPSKVHDRVVEVIAALGTDLVRIVRVHRVRHRSDVYR